MVMAAGLGTRLRPLTYEVPKPLVPVANRPVMDHLLRLLAAQGFHEVIANVHWFGDLIVGVIGDGAAQGVELRYRHEEELTGTAGGVRDVADFLSPGGESFIVLAGDALTDVDLAGLVAAHERNGGVATLAVKRVADVSDLGVIVADSDGRVQGFQEKPAPGEELSDLVNCMIYAFRAEVLDYFPDRQFLDWARDIFPVLLEHDVPFHVHPIDAYWNDVGSIPEYVRGNLDAVEGAVRVDVAGQLLVGSDDDDAPASMPGGWELSRKVLVGEGAVIEAGARIDGPAVLGAGTRIGAGSRVRESILLERAELPADALLAGAIAGRRGALAAA
jgi:mannose-1-phosphate guanylyltransferase